jgi:hypothetical protein
MVYLNSHPALYEYRAKPFSGKKYCHFCRQCGRWIFDTDNMTGGDSG